jgi:hypothetical protein
MLPRQGFVFGRPLIAIHSDDWGRVGVRDAEIWDDLRASGVNLGVRPYDYYSLETAGDLTAVASMLQRHRDSSGRPARLGMNFLMANIDFAKVKAASFRRIYTRPLTEGLPEGWNRPGLFEAYREGVSAGVFSAALHGTTHFCRSSAERFLEDSDERGTLLRTLWKAGVPYIHWRMPWIGFEYADSAQGREQFLGAEEQKDLVETAVGIFSQFFSTAPRSACAPGYRADRSTYAAWADCGIRVVQNGPGRVRPPHFESQGASNHLLHLYRTMDFEPSAGAAFSLKSCMQKAESSFARGIPVLISVHSINFHSSLRDFRTGTLRRLDEFLSAMEAKHPDLLYVRDEDLYDLVDKGSFESSDSLMRIEVKKQSRSSAFLAALGRS